jgi:hypothetical protein
MKEEVLNLMRRTDKHSESRNDIYNTSKKNQILASKLNKECERPLQGELQTSEGIEEEYGRWKNLPSS